MICFRDRAYCEAARKMECVNTKCYRFFGPDTQAAAEKWWGGPEAPIAFLIISADECPDSIKPDGADTVKKTQKNTSKSSKKLAVGNE